MHVKEPEEVADWSKSSGVFTVSVLSLIVTELNFGNAPWMPIMDPVNVLVLTERSIGILDNANVLYPSNNSELLSVNVLPVTVTDSLATEDVLIAKTFTCSSPLTIENVDPLITTVDTPTP